MANFIFDARTVEPDEGRLGAVPAGWYPVAVDQSEIKPTTSGDGAYLSIRFKILDGANKGAFVYHRFNTKNQSEKAMDIGFKQLSALMHAINVLNIQNTEQLHNRPLFVKLKFVPADGQYDAKNEITAFREITDPAAKAGFANQEGKGSAAAKPAVVPPAKTQPLAQAPVQQAAPAQSGWVPSAHPQPWGAQATPNVQQTQLVQAEPATTATAPVTSTETQTLAPASAPAQQAQPTWVAAPVEQTAAPVQQTTTTPAQELISAPASAGEVGETLPPWMQ